MGLLMPCLPALAGDQKYNDTKSQVKYAKAYWLYGYIQFTFQTG